MRPTKSSFWSVSSVVALKIILRSKLVLLNKDQLEGCNVILFVEHRHCFFVIY